MSLQPERGISPHEILGPFVLSVPEVQNLLMQIKVWHPLGWVVPEQKNDKIFQKSVSNCHKGLFITFLTYCLLTLVPTYTWEYFILFSNSTVLYSPLQVEGIQCLRLIWAEKCTLQYTNSCTFKKIFRTLILSFKTDYD